MGNEETGRGGLDRCLDLLWDKKVRPSPGPKPRLGLDRIAEAAIAVAEAEGLAALSMRRVAERLGVTTMALYRYVPGKAELIEVMLDAAIGEPPRLDDVGGGWQAKLALWARATWALFHRHPWSLPAVTDRRLMGPHEMAWIEAGLHALSGTGLAGGEMMRTVMLVNSYVRGAAQLALDAARAEERTGVGEERWSSTYAALYARVAADQRYPTLAGLVGSGTFRRPDDDEPDEGFEFGLQRVLDGIQVFIRNVAVDAPASGRTGSSSGSSA